MPTAKADFPSFYKMENREQMTELGKLRRGVCDLDMVRVVSQGHDLIDSWTRGGQCTD